MPDQTTQTNQQPDAPSISLSNTEGGGYRVTVDKRKLGSPKMTDGPGEAPVLTIDFPPLHPEGESSEA